VTGFPFGPGSAREVRDPAAEAERLAEARKAAEAVTVPRADFEVLLAVATLYVGAFADDEMMTLPEKMRLQEVEEVLKRHGKRY
jgi:hypothetical protein